MRFCVCYSAAMNKGAGVWLNNSDSKFYMYAGLLRHNLKSGGGEGGVYDCTTSFSGVTAGTPGDYTSGDYIKE